MSHPIAALSKTPPRHRGFTLIELMVTIAIVAILSSVAIPAYTDYLRRGKLPDAFTALSDYRVKLEQYYQDNRNYGTAGCAFQVAAADGPAWNTFAASKYFTYACMSSGQGYDIIATSTAALGTSHVYTVNQANVQTTTTFKGSAVVGKNCWLANSTSEC
jgi:type IV pilus assembly protein PilE